MGTPLVRKDILKTSTTHIFNATMQKEDLYFIAIIIPPDIAGEIEVFKRDMADTYNSKAAMKVMPHITLKAPFKLPASEKPALLEWFRSIPLPVKPFKVTLKNFGSFDNKYSKVIYVKPLMSPQLQDLQFGLMNSFKTAHPQINTSTFEHQFSPHITIGYRDLTAENFDKAWAIYQNRHYTSTFTCESFCLLKHNGLRWEVITEHFMPGS